MEHEIEAIWPPAEGPASWDLGPWPCWGPHEWQRLWCLVFILVGGQLRGHPALSELVCRDSALIPLPSSSSALCPFWKPHTQSTLNIAVDELPWAPGRSWLPNTSLKAIFLSFSVRSLPWPRHTALFFLDCSLRVPALEAILAHLGRKSYRREYMQSLCRSQKCYNQQTWDQGPLKRHCAFLIKNSWWPVLRSGLEAWLSDALPTQYVICFG